MDGVCSSLQKLLLDEKSCYIFGRNKECDFPLQHASCSRQHAALVYHKHLKRPFLIDLGSSKFPGATAAVAKARSSRLIDQLPVVVADRLSGSWLHMA